MRVLLMVGVLSLLAMPVMAEQSISIERSVFTKHINHEDWMNEDNKLTGIEYKNNDWYLNASMFTNTFGDPTWTAGIGYNLITYKYMRVDVLGGVAHGYSIKPLPYAAPRVTLLYGLTPSLSVKTSVQVFYEALTGTVGLEYKF
jgi:hypothetical protein